MVVAYFVPTVCSWYPQSAEQVLRLSAHTAGAQPTFVIWRTPGIKAKLLPLARASNPVTKTR